MTTPETETPGALRRLLGGLRDSLAGGPPKAPRPAGSDPRKRLIDAVADHLPDADEDTRWIVTAIAGLLACVAYADGQLTEDEVRAIRDELGRLHGMHPRGVEAIVGVLRAHARDLSALGDQEWSRVVREAGDRELRIEVLEVCVDLAAADRVITLAEVNHLRRLAPALGLSQAEYDALQARHRDKLEILR